MLGPLTDRVLPACQDGFARTGRPMRCVHCWGPECWSPWVIGSGMCLYDQLPIPIESSGPETGMSAPGRRPSTRDRQPSARGGARLAGSGEEAGGGALRGSWGSAHSPPPSPCPCCVCPESLAIINLSPSTTPRHPVCLSSQSPNVGRAGPPTRESARQSLVPRHAAAAVQPRGLGRPRRGPAAHSRLRMRAVRHTGSNCAGRPTAPAAAPRSGAPLQLAPRGPAAWERGREAPQKGVGLPQKGVGGKVPRGEPQGRLHFGISGVCGHS